ncbi:MAG: polysaccharide deacetylase family protein [Actinomycetota bacterium]
MADTGKRATSWLHRIGTLPVLFLSAMTACTGSPPPTPSVAPSPLTMAVTINGEDATVPTNVTLGTALKQLGIAVRDGRLLDVEGGVLETGRFPARFFVNDKRASRTTLLHAGDVVTAESGNDHTEGTRVVRERIDGTQPHNPQYFLGTAPGETVTTVGEVSGLTESVVFDPAGRGDIPRAVALTFDDGPNRNYTTKILAILKRYNVAATFFVVGYEAEKFPNLIEKEIGQGHTVGNHSWSHPLSPGFASLDDKPLANQLNHTNAALTKIGTPAPFVFRPPGGSFDAKVVEEARKLGMRTVIWTLDTLDYEPGVSPKILVRRVLSQVRAGDIILMHDGGGDRSATVKALPDIIEGIRKRGYDFVALTP